MGSNDGNGTLGQGWKKATKLDLRGNLQVEWDVYVFGINYCGI